MESKNGQVMMTDCWKCDCAIGNHGYGVLYLGGTGKKTELAHRVSYTLFKGEIPDGTEIDHLCRNRQCCNPDHLDAVTRREKSAQRTWSVWDIR